MEMGNMDMKNKMPHLRQKHRVRRSISARKNSRFLLKARQKYFGIFRHSTIQLTQRKHTNTNQFHLPS
jgi:hypothetical protein